MTDLFIAAGLGYLLGSIPFGYLLVRIFRGEDVRHSGSGNIGATNVSRTSPALGVLTLILDALKGWLAVWLALRMVVPAGSEHPLGSTMNAMQIHEHAYTAAGAAALCAVIGHMFPVWLKFSGGKGVATGLGAFVTLAPRALLVMALVFIVVVLVFRYVSLASVTAAVLLPVLAAFLDGWRGFPLMLGFMTAASALIIFKHRPNLSRLVAGTENRLHLRHG